MFVWIHRVLLVWITAAGRSWAVSALILCQSYYNSGSFMQDPAHWTSRVSAVWSLRYTRSPVRCKSTHEGPGDQDSEASNLRVKRNLDHLVHRHSCQAVIQHQFTSLQRQGAHYLSSTWLPSWHSCNLDILSYVKQRSIFIHLSTTSTPERHCRTVEAAPCFYPHHTSAHRPEPSSCGHHSRTGGADSSFAGVTDTLIYHFPWPDIHNRLWWYTVRAPSRGSVRIQ